MKIDEQNDRLLIADEGFALRRISDKVVFGKEAHLGYTYYIKNKKLEEPLYELPEHYEEVNEKDIEDLQLIQDDNIAI